MQPYFIDFNQSDLDQLGQHAPDFNESQQRNPAAATKMLMQIICAFADKYPDHDNALHAAPVYVHLTQLRNYVDRINRQSALCLRHIEQYNKSQKKMKPAHILLELSALNPLLEQLSGFLEDKFIRFFSARNLLDVLSARDLCVAHASQDIDRGASLRHAIDGL